MKARFLFLGSTITFLLGFIVLLGGVAQVLQGNPTTNATIAGPLMILFALACRSAKKRRLGHASR